MTDIQMGEDILCINNEGLEDVGLRVGVKYQANNVMVIPGQGDFIGVYDDIVQQILVVDADRFERAYTLSYRLFYETKQYALMDDTFDPEDHKDKGEQYMDVTLILPESQLDNIDAALAHAFERGTFHHGGELETTH